MFGAIAGSLIGGAFSLYSARKNRKAQERFARQQQQMMDRLIGVGTDAVGFGRQQYEQWRSRFMPVLDVMGQEVLRNDGPDYEAIQADINSSIDTARDQDMRRMERYGLNPSDAAYTTTGRQYDLEKARQTVQARQRAREDNTDRGLQRMAQFFQLGNPMMASATQQMGQGYGLLSSAYGQGSAQAGGLAQGAANAYNDAMGGVGLALGALPWDDWLGQAMGGGRGNGALGSWDNLGSDIDYFSNNPGGGG